MRRGGVGKGPIQTMGIQRYLDSTTELHGSNGYDDFKRMTSVKNPNIAEIARKMQVARGDVYRWMKQAGIKLKRKPKKDETAAAVTPTDKPKEDTSGEWL